jgi:hypothetical protein
MSAAQIKQPLSSTGFERGQLDRAPAGSPAACNAAAR